MNFASGAKLDRLTACGKHQILPLLLPPAAAALALPDND